MASVLFVNQFYAPDLASTGQHLTDLAEHLARRGHQVQVLCSTGSYVGGSVQAPARETQNGVHVTRLRAWSPGKRSLPLRLLDAVLLHARMLTGLLCRRADVVVTLTTPPMLGVAGAARRLLRGGRFIYFAMDLHPDVEFALGVVRRDGFIGRLLECIHRWSLRRANACVVLGDTMRRRLIDKGIAESAIHIIPVWNRRDEIVPLAIGESALRRQLGWTGRFVVLYSGNAGLAHTFDEVIAAARQLERDAPDVLFAFVGDGARRAEIHAAAERFALRNIEFHGYVPRAALTDSLGAADVHLITLRPEMAGLAAPSKVYAAMASARPLLFVGPADCEPAAAIHRSGAGFVIAPGDAAALTARILSLRADTAQREELGQRGRRHFLAHHERDTCCDAWADLVHSLASASSARDVLPAPGVR